MVRRTAKAAINSASKARKLIRDALSAGALLTSTELSNYVNSIRSGGSRPSSYSSSSKKGGKDSRAMVLYKKPSSGFRPRRDRYTFAGKFNKPRRRPVMPMCISGKYELAGVQNAHECVYIGHTTHPMKTIVKFIGLGIINWYMKSCRVANTLITSQIGGTLQSAGTATLSFSMSQRGAAPTTEGFAAGTVTAAANDTWEAFGVKISNFLVSVFKTYAERNGAVLFVRNYFEPLRFAISCLDGNAGTSALPTRMCNFEDLYVTISGESNLQVQNRTLSEAASSEIDVIDSNPLRGKVYEANGSQMELKDMDITSGSTAVSAFFPDIQHGVIYAADTEGAGAGVNPWGSMRQYLKKPPRPDIFRRCRKSAYVKVDPGKIKTSHLKASVTKSLHGWMKWLTIQFIYFVDATAATDTGTNTMDTIPVRNRNISFSRVKLYALEKMVDTNTKDNGNQVSVGWEAVLLMKVSTRVGKQKPTSAVTTYVSA